MYSPSSERLLRLLTQIPASAFVTEANSIFFGTCVELSRNGLLAVISASNKKDCYSLVNNGGVWTPDTTLVSSGTVLDSGEDIALSEDGKTGLIGSPNHAVAGAGFIFK